MSLWEARKMMNDQTLEILGGTCDVILIIIICFGVFVCSFLANILILTVHRFYICIFGISWRLLIQPTQQSTGG